jgi:hypothetical protein
MMELQMGNIILAVQICADSSMAARFVIPYRTVMDADVATRAVLADLVSYEPTSPAPPQGAHLVSRMEGATSPVSALLPLK